MAMAAMRGPCHNPIDRMLWLDNHTYPPDCWLVKMDIASVHCGTRSPLLDHGVIEFCARLPVQYKVKDQVGKYLLKKLAEHCFPAEILICPPHIEPEEIGRWRVNCRSFMSIVIWLMIDPRPSLQTYLIVEIPPQTFRLLPYWEESRHLHQIFDVLHFK